jgi:hypothetical protein
MYEYEEALGGVYTRAFDGSGHFETWVRTKGISAWASQVTWEYLIRGRQHIQEELGQDHTSALFIYRLHL